ncbi:Disco-interacting protein 2-like B, partial [Ophiophagus hannah]
MAWEKENCKGVETGLQKESRNQTPTPSAVPAPSSSKYHRGRSGGARDERYRSDIHTEAVQAALAKHKEQKMALPMPTKRRSTFVQSPADACTPPDTSSASEDEGSLRRQAALSAALHQSLQNAESWINRSIQGSSTSSSASSTLSHGEGKGTSGSLADVFANTRIENFSVPPDVTATTSTPASSARPSAIDLPPSGIVKGMHKASNRSSLMDTADGVPVNSRVSTKIQQLLNTLKRPKRPPLKEFFVDDFEEIVEGKLWSRSLKLAYTLLNKLGTKNEPVLKPGDRVALVYPNNDPVMFMVAFYGCLLAEVLPVPIEVPLTRKDAGGQQIGFLLGSCGIALALTTEVCLKGLPKTQNGEIVQFKGWPRLKWVVTDSKYLSKTPKDWQPNISNAGSEPAYIEYKTSKEGSVMGVTVSRIALLSHCQALSQACNYSEAKVALVKCRDLHWAMMAHRDQRDVSLSSLRMLIVTDGANPWSVSSCDAFLSLFQNYGLKPEAICPCATSPEAMTVAIRRPGVPGAPLPGRAILSMNGLSYGVIRVNTEDKNSALTIQDVGHVMPGGMMCIVKPDGSPQLCKTDEIGEICVSARTGGMMYYGLSGVTKNTFEGSLVFVVGKIDGMLIVSGRRHNADDIVATGLAVESLKTVYRGRIAVFSVTVFYDERIVVVAEQRPDASEEDSFQWMSRVLQAIDSIHQVGVYCLALVPANTLPKTPLGGIHISQTKQHFLEGSLHPCNILMCPHTCVTNLPKPRQKQPVFIPWYVPAGVGPASVMVGNLVAGKRIAQASGRDLGQIEENDLASSQWLNECIELIAAFYGCLYAGCIPVTVRPPHAQNLTATLPTVRMIVDVSIRAEHDLPRKRLPQVYKPPTSEMLAYLDFSVSTTGMLTGVKMSHASVSALCRAIKLQCELYSSRQIAICLDPYCGLGFALWCLCSVYSGHQSILIPPMELESNLFLWLSTVSQYKIRDTFCSYSVMDMCTKGLGNQVEVLKARGINLSGVRTCVVVAEERPRVALTQSFSKLFKDIGLSSRAVSTTFGSRVNVAICLQGTSGPDPTTVYVDLKSLRHDRVRLVERGAPQSLLLSESGKILPGVKVIIVNPETKGPVGDSHLGEIWVNSPHTASGYYTIYDNETLQADHFNTRLSFGDAAQTLWARTGYLGFVRRTELTAATGERHDALYVVGALDETLELRGLRYHPIDIETSISRMHRSIAECAVFTWTNLLVVVVELCGCEQEALDLVPLVTNVVLEEHYLIVGVVVVVDPGVIPINSRGEKQRMHLRDSFLADQLDPIYVAYNM